MDPGPLFGAFADPIAKGGVDHAHQGLDIRLAVSAVGLFQGRIEADAEMGAAQPFDPRRDQRAFIAVGQLSKKGLLAPR